MAKTATIIDGMIVERVAIDSIFPDPANVRRHPERNLTAIKGSLARFGQQTPIVVDANAIVRKGNGTLAAAIAMGWTEIDIVRTPLQGSEATAYAVADNRTSELAEWDDAALAETLRALQSEDFDLSLTGFTAEEVDNLTESIAAELVDKGEKLSDEVASEHNPKLEAFLDRRAKSKERYEDKSEVNFWVCLVFQGYDQKYEFLNALPGVPVLYGMYADGVALAEKIGVHVTPNQQKPFKSPLDRKLMGLTIAASKKSGKASDEDSENVIPQTEGEADNGETR